MTGKKQYLVCAVLILGLTACNLPNAAQQEKTQTRLDDKDATITALAAALQAQNSQPNGPAATGTPSSPAGANAASQPTATLTGIPQATDTPTITLTPTTSVPMVSVSQSTNCRSGPGVQYDQVGALGAGQSAQLVGKYTAGNYWIIDIPGGSGTCWLWGQYATTSGNTGSLPEMVPPPTPTPTFTATPSIPTGPKHFGSSVTCSVASAFLFNVHVSLTWQDLATNEDGYYVYHGGTLLATLPANSTSYADDTTLARIYKIPGPPPSITYKLQAFNSQGNSDMRELTVTCP